MASISERERREMLQPGDGEFARFVNTLACPACVGVMLLCLVFNLGMLFLRKHWTWKLWAIGLSLLVTLVAAGLRFPRGAVESVIPVGNHSLLRSAACPAHLAAPRTSSAPSRSAPPLP